MRGITRIRFTNRMENALTEIALMLWPNDSQYEATMTAGPVLLDGRLLDTKVELEGLALRVELPHALSPGKTLDLSIPFWIEAYPLHPFMPQRFGIAEGVLIAPTFYPLVPRIVGNEWQIEAPPLAGDRTNSDTAFYQVKITAPAELTLAASGIRISQDPQEAGLQTEIYITGPMRDFAFALGDLMTESRLVGEVLLNAYVLPQHTDDQEKILDAAATQLALLSELIGPYPYTELDLVDAPGAFGGVEYPGLVYIGTLGTSQVIRPTIHEVAHQWFYALIGDDQVNQPWLDEAAASYTEVLYFERTGGVGMATGYLTDVRALLREYPDPTLPIGKSVGEYPTPSDYTVIVYRKGTLFFDALRRDLGDQVFFEFLRVYFDRYRYGFASAEDFQTAAEETCGCDLDALFDLWVYQGGELPVP
jgi:hypothetical protein